MLRSTGIPDSLVAEEGGVAEESCEKRKIEYSVLFPDSTVAQRCKKVNPPSLIRANKTIHLVSEHSQELCGSALHAGLKLRVWIGKKGGRAGGVE